MELPHIKENVSYDTFQTCEGQEQLKCMQIFFILWKLFVVLATPANHNTVFIIYYFP